MKRTLLVALIVLLLVLQPAGAFAETHATSQMLSMDNYANAEMVNFLSLNECASYEHIQISNPYLIQSESRETDCYVYFIFGDNQCFGALNVVPLENGFASSFTISQEYYPVTQMYNKSKAFSLKLENEGTSYEKISFFSNTASSSNNNVSAVTLKDINSSAQGSSTDMYSLESQISTQSFSQYNVNLAVPHVNNSSANNKGLCWAASVASISNYRKGTSYSAFSLYNALNNLYSGTPEGTTTWYQRAFNYCNMSSCSTLAYGMPVSNLYTQLSNGNPVIFSLQGNNVYHAIVCKSIQGTSTTLKYGFMDPNISGTTYMNFSYDPYGSPLSLNYVSSGGTVYSVWRYARYATK